MPSAQQISIVLSRSSLKRSRARQSCTRCRKHKLKCSGQAPCQRCIDRNEADSCELWYRPTGRPKKVTAPVALRGCAYYSHILWSIALDHAQPDHPAPDVVVWLARLWIMVAVHQDGIDKQSAIQEIALRTMMPITLISPVEVTLLSNPGMHLCFRSYLSISHVQEEPVLVRKNQYAFASPQQLSSPRGVPVKIGLKPVEFLQQISPTVAPATQAATAWVSELFNFSNHGCKRLQLDLCTYEVVTTIQGQSQYTELRDSTFRCIDECTDFTILSFELALPSKDRAEWYCTQTGTLDSFRKSSGVIMDEDAFLQQIVTSFKAQLFQENTEVGVHRFEFVEPVFCMDRQGRIWSAVWEERSCVVDEGLFCYAARKIHSWSPHCPRALQVVAHFSGLAERPDKAEQAPAQSLETPYQVPYPMPRTVVASPPPSQHTDSATAIVSVEQRMKLQNVTVGTTKTEVRVTETVLAEPAQSIVPVQHVSCRLSQSISYFLKENLHQNFIHHEKGSPFIRVANCKTNDFKLQNESLKSEENCSRLKI